MEAEDPVRRRPRPAGSLRDRTTARPSGRPGRRGSCCPVPGGGRRRPCWRPARRPRPGPARRPAATPRAVRRRAAQPTPSRAASSTVRAPRRSRSGPQGPPRPRGCRGTRRSGREAADLLQFPHQAVRHALVAVAGVDGHLQHPGAVGFLNDDGEPGQVLGRWQGPSPRPGRRGQGPGPNGRRSRAARSVTRVCSDSGGLPSDSSAAATRAVMSRSSRSSTAPWRVSTGQFSGCAGLMVQGYTQRPTAPNLAGTAAYSRYLVRRCAGCEGDPPLGWPRYVRPVCPPLQRNEGPGLWNQSPGPSAFRLGLRAPGPLRLR